MAQKFLNGIDISGNIVVDSNSAVGATVLDVQGTQGQLFSLTNSLSGDLFSVSDISGIPILNVNSSGLVTIDGALNSFNVTEFIKHEGDTGTNIQFLAGQMILKNSGGKYINLHSNGIFYFEASAYQFNTGNATFAGDIIGGGSITIGSGGGYNAGAIFSDANWGMIFRSLQASPNHADFMFANSADVERLRITSTGATFTGTIAASNFSGSSAGANTGDQVLPTDFVSAASGGTFGGSLTIKHASSPFIKFTDDSPDPDNVGKIDVANNYMTYTLDATDGIDSSRHRFQLDGTTCVEFLPNTTYFRQTNIHFQDVSVPQFNFRRDAAIVAGSDIGKINFASTNDEGTSYTTGGNFIVEGDGTWDLSDSSVNNAPTRMKVQLRNSSGTLQNVMMLSSNLNANFYGDISATGDAEIDGALTLGTALADAEIASAATWNAKQDALTSSSTVLDGRYYTETESNSLYTRKYTFSPGTNATSSRIYVKLFTLGNSDVSVVGKLASAGDYGDSDRATYEIQIATRSNISFDVYQLSTDAVSDDYEFFYKTVGSTYEIWCKMGDYNQPNTFTKLSDYGSPTYNFDSQTTTQPSDLVAVTKSNIYHEGHKPTLAELGAQASGSYVTANADITGATKAKITYDAKGLVTAGADLASADIPNNAANTSGSAGSLSTIPTWNQSTTGNAATATNSTQLNGFTLARIDNAEGFHTLSSINASAAQAKRYHIGRLYGTPAHWDGNWQNLEIRATAESYESGHMIWRILGDYGGAGTQAGMMDLYLKEATGPLCNRFNITLGTPVDAGWDHSGQDTYYVDLYADAAYYSQWEINIKTYGHGTQNTNPTSGGATTVIYDSPTSTNITDFNLAHATIKHLNHEIYHEGHIPTLSELGAAADTAEQNVQSDWDATSGDALILNKPTIPTDHGDHDGLYLPIGGGILTGDLKINTLIGFQRDGTNYSNYIKSSQYVSEGYDNSGTPPNDRYWLEYGAKGGHHFVVNTDGGAGTAENDYDDFTIWNGAVEGDRLFEVTNAGNTSITGGAKVFGSIESRKNIVSNSNYNIAKISSTRTTNDYGGLNKTYASLDVQTPGANTDGASSAHGLGHLSIKLADNAGNSDLVQKALLRHDGELILGGFYPQTSETELAGLTIRSRYSGGTRNFLRFQTDHSTTTTEWTMAKIYAGDGGNFNGTLTFQVATGSNSGSSYSAGHDAQLETAMFINDTKEVTFYGNISASSSTANFSIVNASAYQLNGTYIVDSSRNLVNISQLRFGGSDAVIDTGEATSATATTAIASVAHATYTAAFFDFVIKNGTNVRAGTVYACHDGTTVSFTETSTVDLGDTSDVTLSVVISTSYLQLRATTTSSTWTIKSLIRAI